MRLPLAGESVLAWYFGANPNQALNYKQVNYERNKKRKLRSNRNT